MPITYYVALPFVLSEESELIPGEAKDFQSSGPENLRHRAPLKLGDLVNKKNSGQIWPRVGIHLGNVD